MWFDAQAALKHLDGAELPRAEPSPPAKPEIPRVANVAGVAGVLAEISKTPPSAEQAEKAFPYGTSEGGRPLTYTGRVVSLEAWRNLTQWERHGPRGRLWCGVNRRWQNQEEKKWPIRLKNKNPTLWRLPSANRPRQRLNCKRITPSG